MDVEVGGARENTIRRRFKGLAAAETRKTTVAVAHKAVIPAPASVPALASEVEPTVELGRVGGAASRLLAMVRGSGGGPMMSGPRRVPIDSSTEAAAGVLARSMS